MKGLISETRQAVRFFRTGLRDFDRTASLFPSQRFLVEAMVQPLPLGKARCVVEIGTGTGNLTRAILSRLGGGGHLHSIEIDARMLAATLAGLHDRRLLARAGDARELPRLLALDGCGEAAEVVISSLGLSLMTDGVRDEIFDAVASVSARDAHFMQFAYAHARFLVYRSDTRMWGRFHARPYLQGRFGTVRQECVLANCPPAMVYACRFPVPRAPALRAVGACLTA